MFFDNSSLNPHPRNLYLVFPYFSTIFHRSTIGSSKLAISFSNTLSSMWSLYEISGICIQVALKVCKILKSSASLSTIVFPAKDCCISSNFLRSILHLTNCAWYSVWINILPSSAQKKRSPFLNTSVKISINNLT